MALHQWRRDRDRVGGGDQWIVAVPRVARLYPRTGMVKLQSCRGLNAVVTGASSGIGESVARRLAQGGARVALVARREDRLRAIAEEIGRTGGVAVAGQASPPPRLYRAWEASRARSSGDDRNRSAAATLVAIGTSWTLQTLATVRMSGS